MNSTGTNMVVTVMSPSGARTGSGLKNERGMALILALVMLVVVTILGAWALDTSSTDLKITGNYKTARLAFYNADAALAYVSTFKTLETARTSMTSTVLSQMTWTSPQFSSGTGTAQAVVRYLGTGPLPAGAIYDTEKFQGVYFVADTQGTGGNNADSRVQSVVLQVVKK